MSDNRLTARIEELEDKLDYYMRNAIVTSKKVFKCGEGESTLRIRLSGNGEVEIFAPSGSVVAYAGSKEFDNIGGGFYSANLPRGDHEIRFSGTAAAIRIEIVGKGAKFC